MPEVYLAKSAIENLSYENADSIDQLKKLIRASWFVFDDIAKGCTPPYPEAVKAQADLRTIETKDRTGGIADQFNDMKQETLVVFETINDFLNDLYKPPQIEEFFHGKGAINQWDKIQFALLMVEKNNLDFFGNRESHMPSQPHDRLSSYCIVYTDAGRININFVDEDLPKYIQAEVLAAFKEAGEPTPAG